MLKIKIKTKMKIIIKKRQRIKIVCRERGDVDTSMDFFVGFIFILDTETCLVRSVNRHLHFYCYNL